MEAELNMSVAKTIEVASAQYQRLRRQKPKRKIGARLKKNIQQLKNMELMKNMAILEVVNKGSWKSDQFIDMVLKSAQLVYILADRTAHISFDEMSVPKPASTRAAITMLRSEYWAWLIPWSTGLVGRGPKPALQAAARRRAAPAIRRLENKLDFLGSLLKYGTVIMPELRQQLPRLARSFPVLPIDQPWVQPMDLPWVPPRVQPRVPPTVQPAVGLQPPPLGLSRNAALRMVSSYLALQVRASYRSGRGARAAFAALAARTGLQEPQVAAFWCRIRAMSLRHIRSLLASGDTASPSRRPRRADWAVADTALLYDTQERVVTEDSLTLYSQSQPLWSLLELSDMLSLEPLGAAVAWREAKQQYQGSGQGNSRQASLVLLQRRWHELKTSAGQRVVALWRARRREKHRSQLKVTEDKGSKPSAPLIPPTRLYEIQLAVVRRYPRLALKRPLGWHTLVREGLVHSDDYEADSEPGPEPAQSPRPPQPPPPATEPESEDDVVIMESPVGKVEPPLSSPQGQKGEDHPADNDEIPPLVFDTDENNTMTKPANSLPDFASLDLDTVESTIIFSDDDSDDGTADVVVDELVEADCVSVSDKDSLGETLAASEFDSVSDQCDIPNDTDIKSEQNDEATNLILDRIVYGNEEECNVKSEVFEGCDNFEAKIEINIEEIGGTNVDYEESLEAKDEVASDVKEFEDTKVVYESFEETETEVTATNVVEPKVGESRVVAESATVIDPKLFQSPGVPLKVEIIRQSELKDYFTNPDFNIKLKELSPSFLKSKRNRRLYRKCVPLTVDLVRMDEKEVEKTKREVKELEEIVRKEREMLDMRCLSFYDEDDGGDDMPTFEELQELLETIEKEKLTATPPEAGGWGPTAQYCCLARRGRVLNEARKRRWGGGRARADLHIHRHARGTKCHCCCVHLLSTGEEEKELRRERLELAYDLAEALKEARGNVEQPMLEVFSSGEEDDTSADEKSENSHQPTFPTTAKRKHETNKKKNQKTTSEIRVVTEDPYTEWERQKNHIEQNFTLPKRSAMAVDVDSYDQKKQRLLEEKCVNIAEVGKKGAPKMKGPVERIAVETEKQENIAVVIKKGAPKMKGPKRREFRIVQDKVADKPVLPKVPPIRLVRVQTPPVSDQDMSHQGMFNQDVFNQNVFKLDASDQSVFNQDMFKLDTSNQEVFNQGVSSQVYQQPLLNISLQVNTTQQNPKQGPTYVQPLISVALLHPQGGEVYQDGQVVNQADQIYQQNQVFQTQSQILNQQQPIFQNQQSRFQHPGPILNQHAAPRFQRNPIFQHTGQILNQQSHGQVLDLPCSSGQFYQLSGQEQYNNQGYPPPGPGYQVGMPQIPVTCHQVNLSNQTIDVTRMLNRAETREMESTHRRVSRRPYPSQPIVFLMPKQMKEAKASKDLLLKRRQGGPGSGQVPCSDGPVISKVGTPSRAPSPLASRDFPLVRCRGRGQTHRHGDRSSGRS